MAKRGRQYEQVVAAVLLAFDPHASVTQGKWVVGPDGRRELDVLVEGTADGRPTKGIVECKDFNPKKTGPVGIAYVDALDSKRRDLGADFSLICSNAGFTGDAIRKAKRVGIGLISVMRKGDSRVRFAVVDEVYARRVRIASVSLTLTGPSPIVLAGVALNDVLYAGLPVANWIMHRVMLLVGANPIVNGSFRVTHALTRPLRFEWPGGSAEATTVTFDVSIQGGWFAHRVGIDSTAGIYDWLRRRVRLAPGGGQLQIKGIDFHRGEPISQPPDRELIREGYLRGEADLKFVLIENYSHSEPVPDLDRFIEPEDLELSITELPSDAYSSAPQDSAPGA